MFENVKNLFSRGRKVTVLVNGKGNPILPGPGQSMARLDKPSNSLAGSQLDGYLQAYADSSWVYACVSRKAQDAAGLPLLLCKRNGKEITPVENHPALDLLASVNNGLTQYDWLECLFSSLELTGNFYSGVYLKTPGGAQLLPYIPSLIEPIPSKDPRVMVSGYKYSVDGSEVIIPAEDMLHLKYYNSLKTGYILGLSPLTAARLALETDDRALRWNLNKIMKGNALSGALKTENPFFNEKKNRDEAIESWKAKHSGENGEVAGVLWGGLDWKELGISQKDMEFLNMRKMTREEILSVYKVPPAVLGLFEYANYANAEMQEKFYWRNGVIPMLRKVEGGLTEKYLPKFGKNSGLFFRFDTSGVQVLQENEDAKSITAARYFTMGVPYNEIAEKLNLPIKNVDGGDIGYLPFSLQVAGQVGAPAEIPPADNDETKPPKMLKRKLTESQKDIKWNAFVKVADKHEARIKTVVQKYFRDQEAEVLARLNAQKTLSMRKVNGDDIIPGPEEAKRLAKILGPYWREIIAQQAALEIENFNFGISFDLTNPRVAAWIEKHGLDASEAINKTTRDALRETLSNGVGLGESIPDLANRVKDVYAIADTSRATLIARTETIAASNQGALEAYKQTGLNIRKGWLSARDERTRDTHIKAGMDYNDAGAIPQDDDFVVGDGAGSAPGQIGLPEEDCNCRCSIYPVIEE